MSPPSSGWCDTGCTASVKIIRRVDPLRKLSLGPRDRYWIGFRAAERKPTVEAKKNAYELGVLLGLDACRSTSFGRDQSHGLMLQVTSEMTKHVLQG